MLQKGFFKEIRQMYIDCSALKELKNLKYKLIISFNSIEDFLASDISNDYIEYFKI